MSDEVLLQVARIPAGEFVMGADDADQDERPAHRTYLDEFYMGVYPVTNEEYARFVRDSGYPSPLVREIPLIVSASVEASFRELAAAYAWQDGTPPAGRDRHPVTLIHLEDANAYCAWVAKKTGKPIRLPTEAEWEKASRRGMPQARYPWGDQFDPSGVHYLPDPALKTQHGTAPVGSYPPNAFRLYDMAGNVWEWVSDWYDPNYYEDARYLNPAGPETGVLRIVRGGAWVNADPDFFRCSRRHRVPQDTYSYSIGFRIAYSAR